MWVQWQIVSCDAEEMRSRWVSTSSGNPAILMEASGVSRPASIQPGIRLEQGSSSPACLPAALPASQPEVGSCHLS